jgi:hypothetical protein
MHSVYACAPSEQLTLTVGYVECDLVRKVKVFALRFLACSESSELVISKAMVNDRLCFAERRLAELLALNGGQLASADPSRRQQLVQEFFFHLVGATEIVASLLDQERKLGFDPDRVSLANVRNKLSASDPVKQQLDSLYASVSGQPVPSNPYTDDAYIFRIRNYRHQVSHRGTNPFHFKAQLGGAPSQTTTHLLLDPRDPNSRESNRTARDELQYMLDLVKKRCNSTLDLL